MGIVFGITGAPEPSYQLLKLPQKVIAKIDVPFEIRRYQPFLVAEVPLNEGGDNVGFSALARYIGVFGQPENVQKSSLAMTAPVITQPKSVKLPPHSSYSPIVLSKETTMQFVLPFNFQSVSDVPVPTNTKVSIRPVPSRIIAVVKFSGSYNKEYCLEQFKKLKSTLIASDLLHSTEDAESEESESVRWSVAQYHPPFTLPFFRRNEVWVELDKDTCPRYSEYCPQEKVDTS